MKQKLAESWDFKVLLHLSIYFSNNIHLATIQFRMRRLNSPMTRSRILAGSDLMISLTLSLALARHDCYGNQRKIPRKDSENLSWRFSWYFERACVHEGWTSARTSKMAKEWLKNRFPENLISLKSEFIWHPRSPDLNPLHFYLRGLWKIRSAEKSSCYN